MCYSFDYCERHVVCAKWEFACHNGRDCIHLSQRCNRIPDCDDSSDELPSVCSQLNFNFLSHQTNIINDHSQTHNTSSFFLFDDWICNDGTTMIKKYLV